MGADAAGLEVKPFEPRLEREVVELIVGIQHDEIDATTLPPAFPIMEVDEKFYRRSLER